MKYYSFYLLSILLFLVGCNDSIDNLIEEENQVINQSEIIDNKDVHVMHYITWVENARVRKYPRFNAEVIDVLDLYEVVYQTGDPSEIPEKATLKGKEFTDVFLQIEYGEGKLGWIFGGCVQPEYNIDHSEIVEQQFENKLKEIKLICPSIDRLPLNWDFTQDLTVLCLYLDPIQDCDTEDITEYDADQIPDTYLAFLKNLKHQLRELHIGELNVSMETIAEHISELKKLQALSIYNANLSGKLPRDIITLQELKELDVHCNEELNIDDIVSSFPKLETLKIGSSSGPRLPIYCQTMNQLKRVEFLLCDGESELDYEPIDQVPVNIHALKHIDELYLEGYTPEVIQEIKTILPQVKIEEAYTKNQHLYSN